MIYRPLAVREAMNETRPNRKARIQKLDDEWNNRTDYQRSSPAARMRRTNVIIMKYIPQEVWDEIMIDYADESDICYKYILQQYLFYKED